MLELLLTADCILKATVDTEAERSQTETLKPLCDLQP
jgi:hypothetical protein